MPPILRRASSPVADAAATAATASGAAHQPTEDTLCRFALHKTNAADVDFVPVCDVVCDNQRSDEPAAHQYGPRCACTGDADVARDLNASIPQAFAQLKPPIPLKLDARGVIRCRGGEDRREVKD